MEDICNHILQNILCQTKQILSHVASHLFLAGGSSLFLTTNAV